MQVLTAWTFKLIHCHPQCFIASVYSHECVNFDMFSPFSQLMHKKMKRRFNWPFACEKQHFRGKDGKNCWRKNFNSQNQSDFFFKLWQKYQITSKSWITLISINAKPQTNLALKAMDRTDNSFLRVVMNSRTLSARYYLTRSFRYTT
jgi:hypothetical protein